MGILISNGVDKCVFVISQKDNIKLNWLLHFGYVCGYVDQ